MTDPSPRPGTIAWRDLCVPEAGAVRDFYQAVVGWTSKPVDMGGYDDYVMFAPGVDEPVAGVCHARGANANLPAQWLVYIVVEDLEFAVERALAHGGSVVDGPRLTGNGAFAVLRDPAGAVCALYQKLQDLPTE